MEMYSVACMVFFGVVVSLQSANGIECFHCGYMENKCRDTFDKKARFSKNSCDGVCGKIKSKSSGAVNRDCRPGVATLNKCEDETINGAKFEVCTCTESLCNGAFKMGGSFVGMMSSIVIYLGLF
ncbi:hypothetical protein ACJMK2_024306 [Sinanodonta woodiana]|uniref:Protein quiver n=1 Tax=Sinanodonta woodiana TaxID=1069815 RepID=A0ABD3T6Y6_SINWO